MSSTLLGEGLAKDQEVSKDGGQDDQENQAPDIATAESTDLGATSSLRLFFLKKLFLIVIKRT